MLPVVVGLVVGIFLLSVFALFSTYSSGVHSLDYSSKTIGANSSASDTVNVEQCSLRTIVHYTDGFHSCPEQSENNVTIIKAKGFAPACFQMFGDAHKQYQFGTPYDFALKPNSTAYLTISYNSTPNEPMPASFFSNYENTTSIYRLDNNGSEWKYVAHNETSIRIFIASSNVTVPASNSSKTTTVTYTISSLNTRQDEIGKTFMLPIYQICAGEYVTIGDRPYSGRLPWD